MDVIIESIYFKNRLVALLHNTIAQIGQYSDVSTVEPLFGEKCFMNFDKDTNNNSECHDKNEYILIQLLLKEINPGSRVGMNEPWKN